MELTKFQKYMINKIDELKYVYVTAEGGVGKTIVSLMSTVDQPTTVIAQSVELKNQWLKYDFDNVDIYTYHEFANKKCNINKNIIIDEAHKISIPKSQRYKQFNKKLKGKKFDKVILLSATPVANNEINVYCVQKLFGDSFPLVKKYKTKTEFTKHFYNWGDVFKFYLNKYINEPISFKDELYDELYDLSNSINEYKFENDMNEKLDKRFNYVEKYIKFNKVNMVDYLYLKKYNVFGDDVYAESSKLLALMQLANSTLKGIDEPLDNEYLRKVKFINNLKHEKIVVAYKFINESKLLMDNLNNVTDDLDKFKNEDYKYYIRQVDRCEGIDIENSDTIVFFSNGYNPVSFQQFKWRVTRHSNKADTIYYYYLVFENTIETQIYLRLEEKITRNKLFKHIN